MLWRSAVTAQPTFSLARHGAPTGGSSGQVMLSTRRTDCRQTPNGLAPQLATGKGCRAYHLVCKRSRRPIGLARRNGVRTHLCSRRKPAGFDHRTRRVLLFLGSHTHGRFVRYGIEPPDSVLTRPSGTCPSGSSSPGVRSSALLPPSWARPPDPLGQRPDRLRRIHSPSSVIPSH